MISRWLALIALLASLDGAKAEEIVLAVSTREIAITSSYTGAEVSVFGLIERDFNTIARSGAYDVVASVQGPLGDIVVQQKSRIGPIWLNTDKQRFQRVPLFFSVLSSRPVSDVLDEESQKRLKLGIAHHLPEGMQTDAFALALQRLRGEENALLRDEKAVSFVRPNLFSLKINLPGKAPTGLYVVNVSVISEGVPLRSAQTGFVVRKAGFDAFIASTARSQPVFYALLTIFMSVFLGWLANVAFRRD